MTCVHKNVARFKSIYRISKKLVVCWTFTDEIYAAELFSSDRRRWFHFLDSAKAWVYKAELNNVTNIQHRIK
jgi:hypothetical protein